MTRRFVWQLFSTKLRSGPFNGVHLVDVTTQLPWCAPADGGEHVHPTEKPTGFVLVCTACLEYAEWEINHR